MPRLTFDHFQPVKIRFGKGLGLQWPSECQGRTLLVTGASTVERAGIEHLVGGRVLRSLPVPPNPSDALIDSLLAQAVEHDAQTVVGFGGGSVMDAAKVVAMLVHYWPSVANYREAPEDRPRRVRLIQVPTTAGTGSEVTRWASLWNDGVKSSIDQSAGFADVALVDPLLSRGMPPRLTLATGLDALSHAMESIWGVHKTPLSQDYATHALRNLGENLRSACAGEVDEDALEALCLASLLAGLALSCTRSAAAHALSYELTGRFGLEHGLAVGLLCKGLLGTSGAVDPKAVARICRAMGVESGEQVQDFIDECFHGAGLKPRLSAFGIGSDGHQGIISQALESNRLANHRGRLDETVLRAVLQAIA